LGINTAIPPTSLNKKHTSVAITEDDSEMSLYLKKVIDECTGFTFSFLSDTVEGSITKLAELKPEVLLLDLGLPDGCGLEVLHFINEKKLNTGVIVLTTFGDEKHVVKAISAGAAGYLLKNDPHQSIEASIYQLIDGGAPITPKIARDILHYFQAIHSPQEPSKKEVHLTKREVEILRKIAKGFTCKEIAEMECLSYHTIATHVRNIYKKLSVSSRAGAVFEAYNLRLI